MLSISVKHPDAEHFIDAKMEQGKVTGANVSVKINDEFMEANFAGSDMSYRDLCEKGPVTWEPTYRKYEKDGFNTPSRKVELFSSRMESHGYEPLPTFTECGDSPAHNPRLAEKYPLYLDILSGNGHSEGGNAAYFTMNQTRRKPQRPRTGLNDCIIASIMKI